MSRHHVLVEYIENILCPLFLCHNIVVVYSNVKSSQYGYSIATTLAFCLSKKY